MHRVAGMIGLVVLLGCPAGLSAQVAPYSVPAPPGGNVVLAAYQQPAAPQLGAGAENQLSQTPPGGGATSSDAAPPLSPQKSHPQGNQEPAKTPGGIDAIAKVGGSLAVVLAIFFLIVWLLRRAAPQGFGALPSEAFEVLGRAALANRQQAQLLRCGNKLLLVCVTPTGAQTLTEITDPAEVDQLVSLCRQSRRNGVATAFRQAMQPAEASNA